MNELRNINTVLNTICEINDSLANVYSKLREREVFKTVHREFDMRKSGGGSLVDAFVEGEITESLAYCWWLEIRFEPDGWSLEALLLKTEHGVQNRHKELIQSSGNSLEEFCQKVPEAIQVLRASAEGFRT